MDIRRIFDLSLKGQGLRYRLSIIFALFFFAPLLTLLYLGWQYGAVGDRFLPGLLLVVLTSSLAGYILVRKTFDDVRSASRQLSEAASRGRAGFGRAGLSDELQTIVGSFRAVEDELKSSIGNLDRKSAQFAMLKELSDLCYATFDSDDLFAVTLEHAMKLADADMGSVMILDGPERGAFLIHATYGLGALVKKGDRVDFATSVAKFAVINKSPLLIDDIEKDPRFERKNRAQYASKSFLCMPLRGLQEVFGVLTLSRKSSESRFTREDVDALTPLLSNAALTHDALTLLKQNQESRRQLSALSGICQALGSSLRNGELLHAILAQFREDLAFDSAMVLGLPEQSPNRVVVLEMLSALPLDLSRHVGYDYTGSCLEGVIRQGSALTVDNPEHLQHPLERELFVRPGLRSALVVPLKMGIAVTGLLVIGSLRPEVLAGEKEKVSQVASLLALAMEKNRLSLSVTKRDLELESIKQIGSILAASTFDRQEVLRHTMDMIRTIMNVEAGSLLLIEKDELAINVAFNANPEINLDALQTLRFRLGQGVAGYSAARGEPVIVSDTSRSRQFVPDFDRQTGFKTRSVLCVPLISRGRVLGVIEILNKINGEFNDDDLHLLQSIATSVSIALENSQLYRETLSMAEQERGIRNMFQKFVPREVVEKIIHIPASEKPLLEDLKTLTLLNIDIRGFSMISKRIGPQRTVAILNHFFASMGDIVFKHHGIVDKYLGDGFLALFGAPVSGATDADNAVAAALEMQSTLGSVNDYFAGELEKPLSMGISIHTGEAVVGNIGFEKKMDYTVIGDSVNIVFRLQDLTKFRPNSILISDKTHRAVRNSILDVREISPQEAGHLLPGETRIYELRGGRPRGGMPPGRPSERDAASATLPFSA